MRRSLFILGAAGLVGALVFLGPEAPLSEYTGGDRQERVAAKADAKAAAKEEERNRELFGLVRNTLDKAADLRRAQQSDPEGPIEAFVWRQVGMDEAGRIDNLISGAFEMIIDTPLVDLQRQIAQARGEIAKMRRRIAELKEERIAAPKDGGLSSWVGLSDDKDSLSGQIKNLEERIAGQEAKIASIKKRFSDAMAKAGTPMPPEQIELLLDSVTGKDIVELAAAYEAIRGVSINLRKLMDETGEDLTHARRYYGMHTVLIAILVEGQTRVLRNIDKNYLPKLKEIERDLINTAKETDRLLADKPTDEQRKALEANKQSQKVALDALRLYREYLLRQRLEVARARERTLKELRVADNTLKTVEASFQLKALMDNAAASFDALLALESPGFERLFRNEELRREFQTLTQRLAPSS